MHSCVNCGNPDESGVEPCELPGKVACYDDPTRPRWKPKSKWLPATKENFMVGKWYWVKVKALDDQEAYIMGVYKFLGTKQSAKGCGCFGTINAPLQTVITLSGIKIQPAPAPPDLEE